ncbi:DUF167-domain-containing protein [Xylaria arbuscula]|nr:DUF167-domain-containing protein [Xylaria arbuscula]
MSNRAAISLMRPKSSAEVLILRCHVRPGVSKAREGVVSITDEAIELCVSAPPQDGKANKAVLEVLSEALGTPKSDLQITHGLKSKDKTIRMLSTSLKLGCPDDTTDIVKTVREKLDPTVSSYTKTGR